MSPKDHYREYVTDKTLISTYNQYQEKYKESPRESDKATASLIASATGARVDARVLDAGCSTGNFLRYLRRVMPNAALIGVDLARMSVEKCIADPDLKGIDFNVCDLLDLSSVGKVDAVSVNAVTYLLNSVDYQISCQSLFDVLKPGGAYVGFELVHPFSVQDLKIVETSEWNPDGLTLHFRPMKKVEAALKIAGFQDVEFIPFVLPIDLPMLGHDADVVSYTRKDEHGERMAFRGTLYQPWCHLVARRPL